MLSHFRSLLTADPESLARETLGLACLVSLLIAWFCLPGLG